MYNSVVLSDHGIFCFISNRHLLKNNNRKQK